METAHNCDLGECQPFFMVPKDTGHHSLARSSRFRQKVQDNATLDLEKCAAIIKVQILYELKRQGAYCGLCGWNEIAVPLRTMRRCWMS